MFDYRGLSVVDCLFYERAQIAANLDKFIKSRNFGMALSEQSTLEAAILAIVVALMDWYWPLDRNYHSMDFLFD